MSSHSPLDAALDKVADDPVLHRRRAGIRAAISSFRKTSACSSCHPTRPNSTPIERLWLHLRDNRLSHCVFQTTGEIVDTCVAARVRPSNRQTPLQYGPRHAAYDLKK